MAPEKRHRRFESSTFAEVSGCIMDCLKNTDLFCVLEKEGKMLKIASNEKYNDKLYMLEMTSYSFPSHVNVYEIDEKYLNKKTRYEVEPYQIFGLAPVNQSYIDKVNEIFETNKINDLEQVKISDFSQHYKIFDIEASVDFFKAFNLKHTLENVPTLIEESLEEDKSLIRDLSFLFDVYDHEEFKDTLTLGDADIHFDKLDYKDKKVITYSSSSSCVSTFTTFVKEPNGNMKVFFDYVDRIPKKFKIEYITIGQYPNIIEHYIENEKPIFEYKDGKIIRNNCSHLKSELYYITSSLSQEIEVEIPLFFNKESLEELMKFTKFRNLNGLYLMLFNEHSKWKFNQDNTGRFIALDKEMYSDVERSKLELEKDDFTDSLYIYELTKSPIMRMPKNALPEWKELAINAFLYVKENYKKFSYSNITKKDINLIEKKLKEDGLI